MGWVSELRRRNVLRMAALYVVSAWLVLQVVDVLGEILLWPLWAEQLILVILVIGLPIALVISWFYEVTPGGVRREEDVPSATAAPHGRAVDFVIISVLCAAVLVFAYDKWWPQAPVARSIAVMPFQNLSGYPEQEYFSDGIAEETLNLLADINALKVIAWTTARSYRDRAVDIATIASELNVTHVLEGSVRKSGSRVRIMAQLIDGADNSHVWSQAYEREVTAENLFEIQQDIATAIASRLRASLTNKERERLDTVPTHSLEAYDAYLLGKQGIARATTASLLEGAEHLRRAIELDPMFAEAHAALAEAYWKYEAITFGKLPEGVTEDSAEQLIDRALELNPDLGFAHAMKGWLADLGEHEAEAAFELALELSPGDPDVYLLYGSFIEDRDRRLEMYRRGLRIDPKSPRLNNAVGLELWVMNRPDEAIVHYKRAIETDRESMAAYRGLGWVNWYAGGRLDESMRWLRIAYSKDPGDINNICMIGWTYLFLNDDIAAERWFRHAMVLAPQEFFGRWGLVDVYTVRGQRDKVTEIFDEHKGGHGTRKLIYLIDNARYEEALEEARSEFPEFFEKDNDSVEYYDASAEDAYRLLERDLWIAMILEGLGDTERAEKLLSAGRTYIESRIKVDPLDYGVFAQVYAALGQGDEAVEALRKMVAGGSYAWWPLLVDFVVFDPIRDKPAFQQLTDEVSTELAIQLERVREMERAG
jgi:TolB-like protein/Tfp pilus assembly protein PilF